MQGELMLEAAARRMTGIPSKVIFRECVKRAGYDLEWGQGKRNFFDRTQCDEIRREYRRMIKQGAGVDVEAI